MTIEATRATRLYPVRAVVVHPNEQDIIRPNDATSLTFAADLERPGEETVRNFLRGGRYELPYLSIVASLGVQDGTNGYLFRLATGQQLQRNFTWRVDGLRNIEASIERDQDRYDPVDIAFIRSSIDRYLHNR